MNPKSILTVGLLVFVAACFVFLALPDAPPEAASTAPTAEPTTAAPASQPTQSKQPAVTTAYYFHGNFRCASCNRIEALTQQAIRDNFATQLTDGSLVWRVVNVEKPETRHFVDDYQLTTRSVVLVERRGGRQTRWKNLDRVWELLTDSSEFLTYIRDEVAAFRREG